MALFIVIFFYEVGGGGDENFRNQTIVLSDEESFGESSNDWVNIVA